MEQKMNNTESQSARRSAKLKKLKDVMGGACNRCGFDDHRALELHHINERQDTGRPSWTTVRDWKFSRIVEEYGSECVLYCANCHKITHFNRRT